MGRRTAGGGESRGRDAEGVRGDGSRSMKAARSHPSHPEAAMAKAAAVHPNHTVPAGKSCPNSHFHSQHSHHVSQHVHQQAHHEQGMSAHAAPAQLPSQQHGNNSSNSNGGGSSTPQRHHGNGTTTLSSSSSSHRSSPATSVPPPSGHSHHTHHHQQYRPSHQSVSASDVPRTPAHSHSQEGSESDSPPAACVLHHSLPHQQSVGSTRSSHPTPQHHHNHNQQQRSISFTNSDPPGISFAGFPQQPQQPSAASHHHRHSNQFSSPAYASYPGPQCQVPAAAPAAACAGQSAVHTRLDSLSFLSPVLQVIPFRRPMIHVTCNTSDRSVLLQLL